MAAHPKSVLMPSLAARLSALRSPLRPNDEAIAGVLSEMATIPPELVVRAGQEIAGAAGLGWWHRPPVREPPAETLYGRLLQKLYGRSQSQSQLSERDLLQANPDYGWVFLFHPDGHVREAALHAIKRLPPAPFFSAVLALRLNDWVPQVRMAAKQCLQRAAPQLEARVLADAAFYLLTRRFVWRRWRDEAGILDQIFARDDVLAALASELEVRTTGAVRACFRQALRFRILTGTCRGLRLMLHNRRCGLSPIRV
jgi:hypothetical protein